MNTLIVPCAGKSSHFPNMKPKWMLTHPDGNLMIQKSLSGLNLEIFDRIVITIVKPHCDEYDAHIILGQAFENNKKVELCILDDFTKSASETIYLTLKKMNIEGHFVIKDSDNYVKTELPDKIKNYVIGCNLNDYPEISNVFAKSFLILNEQNMIQDIIEKKVVSNIISVGVYAFENAEVFKNTYLELIGKNIQGELFISHIISYLLSKHNIIFEALMAEGYEDWGTIKEWQKVQEKHRTYFIDLDGVIYKNCGKYGKTNWSNNTVFLENNIEKIKELQSKGGQIIITTSRSEEYRNELEKTLKEIGIEYSAILMGLNHSARVVINDFAPTNPYPSAIAISLPRDSSLKPYLK